MLGAGGREHDPAGLSSHIHRVVIIHYLIHIMGGKSNFYYLVLATSFSILTLESRFMAGFNLFIHYEVNYVSFSDKRL